METWIEFMIEDSLLFQELIEACETKETKTE
jgi:hypothetical protein